MITEASGVLARAGAGLGASVYYKQVTIVVPPAWTEADCRVKITAPDRGLAYQVRTVFFITQNNVISFAKILNASWFLVMRP